MFRFISFGSGSCGNCYYIFVNGCGIMIDAGIGIRKIKKYFSEYGFSFSDLKCIFITHDHADHVKSVGVLSNTYNIPVFATRRVHEGIRRNYRVNKKIDNSNINVISAGENVSLFDGISLCPFHVPHDSLDNVGYKINIGSVTFCLMTDIGEVTEEMARVIGDADYLTIEANYDKEMLWAGNYPMYLKQRVSGGFGHLSNELCAKAITTYSTDKLRHVWLCHLSAENNHPELARKTVETMLQSSDSAHLKTLPVDVLKRGVPSNIYELEDY